MIFKSRHPFYKQHDVMDCGPTCLRMVAKYHGKAYSLQYLREKSFASREGASLLGLRHAAESMGMTAQCVLASFDYLKEEVALPCIVHWGRDHFVVVYKIEGNRVHIADPAYGMVKKKKESFLSSWAVAEEEGYALLLTPTEAFLTKQEERGSEQNFFFLFSYLKPYSNLLFQLLLAMLLGSALQLALPFLTQAIVDRGISNKNIGLLQMILAGQFVLIAGRIFVNYLRGWILFYISTPINITLIYDFLVKLTSLPIGFFDVKTIGDTLQRIADHHRIESFLTSTVLSILLTFVNILVFGMVLAYYSLPIFLFFTAGTLLYLVWLRLFLAKRREIDHLKFQQLGKNHSAVIQLIMGMQDIRLNNGEEKKIKNWVQIQDDLFSTGKKSLSLTQNQESGCFLLQETQNIVITYFAASFVIEGSLTLGMMLAVQFILGQLNGPVQQLVGFIAAAQDAKISSERIAEIHSLKNEEHEAAGSDAFEIPREAGIVLSDLSFQYSGPYSEKVLKGISAVLPYRKKTAIVGTSGSGKTTLLKLLLGVYQPVSGQILIGARPLTEISKRSWRAKCGVVLQDGYLFSDTIAGNIALKGEIINPERLKYSAQIANIDEFVNSLPLGYQTRIGAEGHGLSQGQIQRILIARAVYKEPDYIFFDEATNSLDASNESAIMKNLDLFFKNRTVVTVAHRLSTVKNADQIIVLDKGAIAEIGTHQELIQRQGAYFHLVKDQLELVS